MAWDDIQPTHMVYGYGTQAWNDGQARIWPAMRGDLEDLIKATDIAGWETTVFVWDPTVEAYKKES